MSLAAQSNIPLPSSRVQELVEQAQLSGDTPYPCVVFVFIAHGACAERVHGCLQVAGKTKRKLRKSMRAATFASSMPAAIEHCVGFWIAM